jgi:hypothetical protein
MAVRSTGFLLQAAEPETSGFGASDLSVQHWSLQDLIARDLGWS